MIINRILNWVPRPSLSGGVQIDCQKEYYGTEYGGYWVSPDTITKDSIVYSFGVGEDISFDLDSKINQMG